MAGAFRDGTLSDGFLEDFANNLGKRFAGALSSVLKRLSQAFVRADR
jgi:hypothetical protein